MPPMPWPMTLEQSASLIKDRCATIRCDVDISEDELCSGNPSGCVSILRFLFTRYSAGLSEHLIKHGHKLDASMSDVDLLAGILAAFPIVSARPAGRASVDRLLSTTDWVADRLLFTLHCIMACTQKASELASIDQVATARARLATEGTGRSGLHGDSHHQANSRSGNFSDGTTVRRKVFDDSSLAAQMDNSMLSTRHWVAQKMRDQLQTVDNIGATQPAPVTESASAPRKEPMLSRSDMEVYMAQLAEAGLGLTSGHLLAGCDEGVQAVAKQQQDSFADRMGDFDLEGKNGGLEEETFGGEVDFAFQDSTMHATQWTRTR